MSDENTTAIDGATAVARTWLALVDQGKYGAAWDESAGYLRRAVKRRALGRQLRAARTPFGPLTDRTLTSAEYRTTLPGAPDGEYVVIQFAASFEEKQQAVETVTPMREPDGEWRVSGYYIK